MPDLAVGTEFGGCRVEAVIGRGGMGVVYRGYDLQLERPVAIKLIASEYAGDPGLRRRFEHEARSMAAIDHPNVIPVYGAGEEGGHLYLVMRYVPGTDLGRLLKERGRLPPLEAARIVNQVAQALDAAHAQGLIHRDIKPANVLLSGDHAYLTDFGITRSVDSEVRATESGEQVGTLDFMSPEHLRGEPTDARSDVYSLGCLLYACLAGSPPFHRPAPTATILAHIGDPPPTVSNTPGVPRQFDTVIQRALAKRPAQRYPSAGQLGQAALAAAGKAGARERRIPRRRPRWAGRAAVTEKLEFGPGDPGHEPATRRLPRTSRTRVHPDLSPPVRGATGTPPPRRVSALRPGRLARRSKLALAMVVAAVLIGGGILAAVADSGRTPTPIGPLTASEVSGAALSFAADYGHRNARALAEVLAPSVVRVAPGVIQRGRPAVLAEYVQQFKSNPILAYDLRDLSVVSGWIGRVAGDYTVRLKGGGTITGNVVFAVQRIHRHVVIGLITTQQET